MWCLIKTNLYIAHLRVHLFKSIFSHQASRPTFFIPIVETLCFTVHPPFCMMNRFEIQSWKRTAPFGMPGTNLEQINRAGGTVGAAVQTRRSSAKNGDGRERRACDHGNRHEALPYCCRNTWPKKNEVPFLSQKRRTTCSGFGLAPDNKTPGKYLYFLTTTQLVAKTAKAHIWAIGYYSCVQI